MLLVRLLTNHRSLATCRPHVSQSVAHASNQLHDSIGWESTILSDDRRAQVTSPHPSRTPALTIPMLMIQWYTGCHQ